VQAFFGKKILEFQNNTHSCLAECKSEAGLSRAPPGCHSTNHWASSAIRRRRPLSIKTVNRRPCQYWLDRSAKARLIDRCLQLFGGYGYNGKD